jgi:class 3 adenylate cyclase
MRDPVDRAVRAISRRNSYALVWLQFGSAHLVVLGGIGLFRLYQPMSSANFWLLVGVSQAIVAANNIFSTKITKHMWAPVRAWERGARDPASSVAAWLALATLPLEYERRMRRSPFLAVNVAFLVFVVLQLGLSWALFPVLVVGASVVLMYAVLARYFTMEIVTRPVLERVAQDLPADFVLDAPALPLRLRLLAVGPVVNVVTGVVVAGLVAHGHNTRLADLGIAWVIAVAVSFTISLELVVLVVRSLASSLRDLRRATERVRAGDFSARVPVVSTDETGALAQSFNTMVEGLGERERLREAFGAYVDPGLAERVLREGIDLAGDDVLVTVLFLDICDFTSFAEQAGPHEVVALLNGFWEAVVPVLVRHGGHANKFIGDGLLAVFGAPDRFDDHALRGVAAALEIAAVVRERYGSSLRVGIGVNSGRVIAGTVGGGGRLEFTVIGDTVNTAARVEGVTRETGDEVLITEATRALLPAGRYSYGERPPVALKGKRESVRLWAVAVSDGGEELVPSVGGDETRLSPTPSSVGGDETRQDQPV